MAKRGSAQQLWLITIPPSHYCERARWALDYAGIPFQERPWPPLLHLAGVARGTIKHGKHTVPQLVAGKALFADSGDIVALANDHMSGSLSRSAHSSACPEPPVATVSNCSTHHLASYTSEGRTVAQLPQPLYPTDPEELRQVPCDVCTECVQPPGSLPAPQFAPHVAPSEESPSRATLRSWNAPPPGDHHLPHAPHASSTPLISPSLRLLR